MSDWFSRLTIFALLALALAGQAAFAQLPQAGRQNAIRTSLVAESSQVTPGETVTLAFVMRPKVGWHGYWQNPGDAGIGARVEWTLPPGAGAGPLRYPVPGGLIISGLMNYVYERDYALLVDVKVPESAAPGTALPIAALIDYLACTDEICVPENASVETRLEVVANKAAPPTRAFDSYRQALPKPLGAEAAFEVRNGRFRMAIPLPRDLPLKDGYFFPVTEALCPIPPCRRPRATGTGC